MFIDSLIDILLDKCDIYYENNLISKENIIKQYIEFLADSLSYKEHSVSIALHTGSICFDIISVVAIAIECLFINMKMLASDDVLSTLPIGNMVIFRGERHRWCGIEEENNKKYMILEQDGKGKNGKSKNRIPFEKNKYLVKPYYGQSERTDGRGIRHEDKKREEFLSDIFDIPLQEIPNVTKVSSVIVTKREKFEKIYKKVKIVYGNKKQIELSDIISATYYTDGGEEYPFGKNPTKEEAVLKVSGKISVARNLVLNKDGNKVMGLLVTDINILSNNSSELEDLCKRDTLQFLQVSVPFWANIGESFLNIREEVSVFACTKEFLSLNAGKIKDKNFVTKELERQIANSINNTISCILVPRGWMTEEFYEIKKNLLEIKKTDMADERKEKFLILSYGLLKLLTTAIFPLKLMEDSVKEGKVKRNILSLEGRISELWNIVNTVGEMKEKCIEVVTAIEQKYQEFLLETPKATAVQNFIKEHRGKKIAIIVPKEYYSNLLKMDDSLNLSNSNVTCVTTNRFDSTCEYDTILVVGDISGKKFNPFLCYSAKEINVLMYECEKVTFEHKKRTFDKFEKKLNAQMQVIKSDFVISEEKYNNLVLDEKEERVSQEFFALEQYIENLYPLDIGRVIGSGHASNGINQVSEVEYVGSFVTGEYILFSKYYSPVIFDKKQKRVIEKNVNELKSGDKLVFIKRDNYTQNIVDTIYENLLKTGRLSPQIISASEKADYWKKALKEFKEKGNYTYRDIAEKLRELGSSLQEATIYQWLVEGSHIIGPRDVETIKQIAQLTNDTYILNDVEGHFDACKVVRHERNEILKLIGRAINDKLSGNIPLSDSVFEIVYDNVENISEILELESISELDESVNVNISLVNRPITEEEVAI